MPPIAIPPAITAFIDATNRADSDAFVNTFTTDAVLSDWGRLYVGHPGVRAWDRTDNIGVSAHFSLVDATAGSVPDSYVVTLTVTGEGYNGTGPMTFGLRDGLIAQLTIGEIPPSDEQGEA